MRKLLVVFTVLGVIGAPAAAQAPASVEAPEAKQKTVKKMVCKRVETDQVSGSRLGSTSKVCREVEVPVKDKAQGAPEDHSNH